MGPHHDKAEGGVRCEDSARPINAERRKPVVHRGESTQKTHQAVKGLWAGLGERSEDRVTGFYLFFVVWLQG